MPEVICKQCKGISNSAISEYWMRQPFVEGECDGCYARLNASHEWERGCLYGQGGIHDKLADRLIGNR